MYSIKEFVKTIFRSFGYDIVQYYPDYQNPPDVFGSLVKNAICDGMKPFVLQIGANDGVRSDPVYDLIRTFQLPGLLIEPIPDYFSQLINNYSNQPQLQFENCAISYENGKSDFYRVSSNASVPDWVHGISSLDRRHLEKERRIVSGISGHIEKVSVRTSTLRAVLNRHRVSEVNVLQIDTEGFDFDILKIAFETGLMPEIIQYENCHLSPNHRVQAHKLLFDNKYKFIDVGMDTVATVSKNNIVKNSKE